MFIFLLVELMFMDMMNYNSNGAPHGGFTHGGNGQDQFRQGNVGNGQPQLSQDNPSAGQQQMSQQRNGLRQIGRPHQQLSDPMASAQTVNNGTNVYNFYFVNSGQYGVNFSGSNEGPGIRSQGYPAFSQQSNTAVQQSVSGQFGGGNNEIPASVHPNQGFNPAMASAPRYHQPTVHGSTGAQTFNPTIASTPSMNRSGYHQLPFQHSSFQPSLSQR